MVPTRAKSLKYSITLWRRHWQRHEGLEAEEKEAWENTWNRWRERWGWGAKMRNRMIKDINSSPLHLTGQICSGETAEPRWVIYTLDPWIFGFKGSITHSWIALCCWRALSIPLPVWHFKSTIKNAENILKGGWRMPKNRWYCAGVFISPRFSCYLWKWTPFRRLNAAALICSLITWFCSSLPLIYIPFAFVNTASLTGVGWQVSLLSQRQLVYYLFSSTPECCTTASIRLCSAERPLCHGANFRCLSQPRTEQLSGANVMKPTRILPPVDLEL